MMSESTSPCPPTAPRPLRVNGETRAFRAETLAALMAEIGIQPARRLAVAVNGALVPRAQWAQTALSSGDRVEIVQPLAGG